MDTMLSDLNSSVDPNHSDEQNEYIELIQTLLDFFNHAFVKDVVYTGKASVDGEVVVNKDGTKTHTDLIDGVITVATISEKDKLISYATDNDAHHVEMTRDGFTIINKDVKKYYPIKNIDHEEVIYKLRPNTKQLYKHSETAVYRDENGGEYYNTTYFDFNEKPKTRESSDGSRSHVDSHGQFTTWQHKDGTKERHELDEHGKANKITVEFPDGDVITYNIKDGYEHTVRDGGTEVFVFHSSDTNSTIKEFHCPATGAISVYYDKQLSSVRYGLAGTINVLDNAGRHSDEKFIGKTVKIQRSHNNQPYCAGDKCNSKAFIERVGPVVTS